MNTIVQISEEMEKECAKYKESIKELEKENKRLKKENKNNVYLLELVDQLKSKINL